MRAIAARIALTLLLVVLGFALVEQGLRWRAEHRYPPVGRRIDLDGRRLQINCEGSGSPTVVLESGLDSLGPLAWSRVQEPLAKLTRTCAYSRAGILWSDPNPERFRASQVALDLHAALGLSGERLPYVMVGHSLGALYAVIFTDMFPADVAGLVLVDPSHPDQQARFSKVFGESEPPGIPLTVRVTAALASFGVPRWTENFRAPPSAPLTSQAAANSYSSTSAHSLVTEQESVAQTLSEAGKTRNLGERPVIVLTESPEESPERLRTLGWTPEQAQCFFQALNALHDDEAAWSSHGRNEVVPQTSHYIQFDRPDRVVAAVSEVVSDVRNRETKSRSLQD
jgi:pimeloyl-ACP methyl ester carboxylesterase